MWSAMSTLVLAVLTLTLTLTCHAAVVMQQENDVAPCKSLQGVWQISRPKQNYYEYFRIEEFGDSILLKSQSDRKLDFGIKMESTDYKNVIKAGKFDLINRMNSLSPNCSKMVLKDESVWTKVDDIVRVHLIYMNHLDVGYNVNHKYPGTNVKIPGYVLNVLNWYFQVYFPRAIRLGNELRETRANETFIYTTHPWLVSLYLDCPDWTLSGVKLQCPTQQQVEAFRRAVWIGDITWHAGPLNQEAESSNPELFSYSLSLSQTLDNQFGIKRDSRTLSQRDVPGMTRAAIPWILAQNIDAISFGVNGGSAPPDVPSPNVWKFGKYEIITIWHKGGYPHKPGTGPKDPGGLRREDCQFVKGLNHVLCFAFRSDNLGPPDSVSEIKTYFEILRSEFPGSVIKASRFEEFTKMLKPLKKTFPVVDAEIGDTWIQGPASDPVKMMKYRTINRLRSRCLKLKQCDVNEKRFADFSRILIKLPEHTYGLASCFDNVDWANEDFQPKQYLQESFKNNTMNYLGHRAFNDFAVNALKDHPLAKEIRQEFVKLKPYMPQLHGYRQLADLSQIITCKSGIKFQVGRHGGLVGLQDTKGQNWASKDSPIAKILYRTYSEDDYVKQSKLYNWANLGAFWKINYQKAKPEGKFWDVEAHGVYVPIHGDPCAQGVYVRVIHTDMNTWWKYGAPTEYFLRYRSDGDDLEIDYQFFNKPSTKMVEALFLSFETPQKPGYKWFAHKVGYWIDPSNIVNNGSQYVHAVDFGVGYLNANQKGMLVESPDAATISVLTKTRPADMLPVPLTPMKEKPSGMAFNFYNNVWDTNFIFWYPYEPQDKHYKARFKISFA